MKYLHFLHRHLDDVMVYPSEAHLDLVIQVGPPRPVGQLWQLAWQLNDSLPAPAHDLAPEDVGEAEQGDGEEEDGGGELVVQPLQPGVHHPRGLSLGLEESRDPKHSR